MSEYTDLLPALDYDQYRALRDDIAERGQLVPIELDENGEVLDGGHRLRACQELGIEPQTITRVGLDESEKRAHVVALNLQRRHLDRGQKRDLIARLVRIAPERSNRQHAEAAGVSDKTVGSVRAELERRAEIPHVEARTDSAGRQQPATKTTERKSQSVTTEIHPALESVPGMPDADKREATKSLAQLPEPDRNAAVERIEQGNYSGLEVLAGHPPMPPVQSVSDMPSMKWNRGLRKNFAYLLAVRDGGGVSELLADLHPHDIESTLSQSRDVHLLVGEVIAGLETLQRKEAA